MKPIPHCLVGGPMSNLPQSRRSAGLDFKVGVSFLLTSLFLTFAARPVRAGEYLNLDISNYSNEVVVDEITHDDPYDHKSLPGFKAHSVLPYIFPGDDGKLTLSYTVGQTHGASYLRRVYSNDYGQSWYGMHDSNTGPVQSIGISQDIKPAGQNSYAYHLSIASASYVAPSGIWTANGRDVSTDGGLTWQFDQVATYHLGANRFDGFSNQYAPILADGNTLYMTAAGIREGDVTGAFESVLFASTDGGLNWQLRSTIAVQDSSPNIAMTQVPDPQWGVGEGPSETALVKLDNGELLSVFRSGNTFPYVANDFISGGVEDPTFMGSLYWAKSSDGGFNWSAPKMLGVDGIFPQLAKLGNGAIVLATGRPGASLMVADETGERWSMPTKIHDGPSSGQINMVPVTSANDRVVVMYDKSSFYPPSWDSGILGYSAYRRLDGQGNEFAEMVAQEITVSVLPDLEFWDYEYHGDVTPASLDDPWQLISSHPPGQGVSTYLYAWQGQDYMRLDGGPSGPNQYERYVMAGSDANLPWGDVDFEMGVQIEMRARVSEDTAEGTASLRLADEHGYVKLDLSSQGAFLEGLGGNPSQLEYLESLNPGFSTSDWHTYQIFIQEDVGSGDIIAYLSIDDLAIGTSLLNPIGFNNVQLGDLAGSANGRFDIDFFRFASISSDFNQDGSVDGLDFLILQSGLGSAGGFAQGDADGNGFVDAADLAILEAQYGIAPLGGAVAAVPEPGSVLLMASGLLAATMLRRRQPMHSFRILNLPRTT